MRTSETISEFATALAAAQAEYPKIPKARQAKVRGKTQAGTAYEYSYKYADISDVLDGLLKVLGKNGLSVIQPTEVDAGAMWIKTRLMHSSGQWIESDYPVCNISGGMDHQKVGASLTYARRYALCSLAGIAADEDVDGEGGGTGGEIKERSQRPARERDVPSPRQTVQHGEGRPLPPSVNRPAIPKEMMFDADESAEARDALLASLATVDSTPSLNEWAGENQLTKDRMTEADQAAVRSAFNEKKASITKAAEAARNGEAP